MGRIRPLFPTLSLASALALAGCTATTTNKPPPTPQPQVAASPAEDPMLVTLEGALANRFMHAAKPGEVIARLRIDSKPFAGQDRPPVNLALAIDTSGSMEGDAIEHARDAALKLLGQLEVGDRLAVIAFHSTTELLVPSTEVSDDNRAIIAKQIETMKATGTTDMAGGLSTAVQQLAAHRKDDVISRLVLLSDGVPNDETPIMSLAQNARGNGITITALGLGVEYNETLLAGIAQSTGGSFHYVDEPAKVASVFREEVLRLKRVVARGMTLTLNPGPGVAVQEIIGLPMQKASPRIAYVQLGDLSEGKPRDVFVRLQVGSHREGANVELLDGVLSFTDAVAGAGSRQRRVFLGARATSDTAKLREGRNQEIEEAIESARAATATINAVANARAGNIAEAQRILDIAEPNARAAATRYKNAKLGTQADEMNKLRKVLPTLVNTQPTPQARPPGRAMPTPVPTIAGEDAPATIRAVHGNAMETLQGN